MTEPSWDFRADYRRVRAAREARFAEAPAPEEESEREPVDFGEQVRAELGWLRSGTCGTRFDERGRVVPPSGS